MSAPALADFSVPVASLRERPREALARLQRDGLVHVRGAVPADTAAALRAAVDVELATRRADNDERWFGNVYGFQEKGQRWDLKLALGQEVVAALGGLLGHLQGVLEAEQPSWTLAELAAMCTRPGDPGQPVHADTSQAYDHRIVTAFVALHDIQECRGPTRMYPRTHTDNLLHLGLKTLDERCGVLCAMTCGDCVLMDSRLLHHGTANTSPDSRYLFYTSWAPEGGTFGGSTKTLLAPYEQRRLPLSKWREWILDPPPVALPAMTAIAAPARVDGPPCAIQQGVAPGKGAGHFQRGRGFGKKRLRLDAGGLDSLLRRAEAHVAWLREKHGVDLTARGLKVFHSPKGGLGMFATRRFHPGETLARIPAAALLHAGRVSATAFGRQVLAALGKASLDGGRDLGGGVMPEELLWLYMVWGREEAQACPWFEYLQSMPEKDPLSWCRDDAALRWLEGTPLADSTRLELERQRLRHASIVGALCAVDPDAFPPSRFGLGSWMWARSCYLSRAFRHQSFPSECVDAAWQSDILVPVLDIFNHRHSARVELSFGTDFSALVLPLDAEPYEAGDEVFNLYGAALSNADLLSHYGFARIRNPHDAVQEVEFTLPRGEVELRLGELRAAAIPDLSAAAAPPGGGAVLVRLPRGLQRGLLETPQELLNAASLLCYRQVYDEETASCAEKARVSKAVASALRRMLRRTAPLTGEALRSRRRRAGSSTAAGGFLRRCRASRARAASALGLDKEVAFPKTGAERAAAIYAAGLRRILRDAADCAEGEAELAELTLQLDQGEAGAREAGV